MQKRFIICVMISLLAIFLTFYYINRPKTPTQEDLIRNTFNATCTVDSLPFNGYGTGVLLDTGYVLTAAHIVDGDMDKKLTPDERNCVLGFRFGLVPGRVVFIGKSDFAIIEPFIDLRKYSSLTASNRVERLGEQIYTVGAMDGRSPHVTGGFISLPEHNMSRASCFISGGNSGGAIISQSNEHLGVVSAVGIRREFERIHLQRIENGKAKFMTMVVPRTTEINTMCLFTSTTSIRKELSERNFLYLLDLKKDDRPFLKYLHNDPMIMTIQLTVLKLWIFLVAVAYVREHLFG